MVRQLEKQKSGDPPLHTKRSLESNAHFTFQALPGSVWKLETSCQKEKCCQGPTDTSWLLWFWPRVHTRAWSRGARFDCFFHNLLNIGNFSIFFGPRYISRFKRREWIKAQYRGPHRLVRALIFVFRKFHLFNCSSPHVSPVEAGQVTCCVIGDNWLVNHSTYFNLTLCSFQPGRRVSVLG
jgi:hypothetical protein